MWRYPEYKFVKIIQFDKLRMFYLRGHAIAGDNLIWEGRKKSRKNNSAYSAKSLDITILFENAMVGATVN